MEYMPRIITDGPVPVMSRVAKPSLVTSRPANVFTLARRSNEVLAVPPPTPVRKSLSSPYWPRTATQFVSGSAGDLLGSLADFDLWRCEWIGSEDL